MLKALTGTLLGAVALTVLATPGAVYMAQARRPVMQPVEYVTVPGPTVTETATERVTEHDVDKIIVPLPGLEEDLGGLLPLRNRDLRMDG